MSKRVMSGKVDILPSQAKSKTNPFDSRGTMHHMLAGNTVAKQTHHNAKNYDIPNIRPIFLLHFMLPVT